MFELIVYLLLSILVSFLCSLLEASLLSLPQSYISSLINQGNRFGPKLQALKSDINRPLAAILTLNTIAHTIGAAGVGAKVLEIYGDEYVALSSGLLTIAVLILSEIIPKTIGALYAKPVAKFAALIVPLLVWLTLPFVIVSERISRIISHTANEEDQKFTRDEMLATAEIGQSDGAIEEKESLIIKNLLNLNELNVQDIMTPISKVMTFPQTKSVREIIDENPILRYSRYPVYGENLNDITGMVLRYQIMKGKYEDGEDLSLEKMLNPVRVISRNLSVAAALQQFIKYREHLFVVVNDYGATTGIVTLEDSIEALLGEEIIDELDYDSETDFRLEHELETGKYIIKRAREPEEEV